MGTHSAGNKLLLVPAFGAVAFTIASAAAADVERGKALFQACVACHSERPDAIGPTLRGVYGRASASVEGYRYSAAMVRTKLTWDEANLRDYLKDPQAKVRGNHMPSGGHETSDIDDLVAYLKEYK